MTGLTIIVFTQYKPYYCRIMIRSLYRLNMCRVELTILRCIPSTCSTTHVVLYVKNVCQVNVFIPLSLLNKYVWIIEEGVSMSILWNGGGPVSSISPSTKSDKEKSFPEPSVLYRPSFGGGKLFIHVVHHLLYKKKKRGTSSLLSELSEDL